MAVSFSWLKKDSKFLRAMKKMSLNVALEGEELEFLLSCAVLFLKEYASDRRKSPYFEISYYIVLKCAVNNGSYEPLLDVSSNFGLYPVSKYIIDNELFSSYKSTEFKLSYQLEKYRYRDIIETYDQKQSREALIDSSQDENSYVAPTSYGKSSLIIEIINNKKISKTAIIVPTKSLLIQTYKLIKNNFLDKNIIFHDEMYDGSDEFVAIFTQERALRLMKDDNISFDLLIIDEAHNLFEMNSRSLLLTRLIRRNRQRNPRSINYYLSPLISDSNNLKVDSEQDIFERRIVNNIKEADIHELNAKGEVRKYNRFLDEFFLSGESDDFINYVISSSKNKNFLYLRRPKKIEELAVLLSSKLADVDSIRLNELSDVISKNVHRDFYCVDYIKKGLVYLHGKLPDLIKEYLEFKFSENQEVKYVVANSVILEGVNLPVDNLYILNTYSLDAKSLTNLIGRVNRLNEVFDDERRSLDKLLPTIHFVNSEFNGKNGNMENKIRKLKSSAFSDSLGNPLLENFNMEKICSDLEKARESHDTDKATTLERKIDRYKEIKEKEDFLVNSEFNKRDKVKKALLESNVLSVYNAPRNVIEELENRVSIFSVNSDWSGYHVIDKIYLFFIKGLESSISKQDFLRLRNESARAFYKKFTEDLHRLSLKEHISATVRYFQSIKGRPQGKEFYIGSSYGEFARTDLSGGYSRDLYLDLSTKTDKELANLSLVKIKIESDFVSYVLNDYVNVLFDLGVVSEEEYNLHIYGTTKKSNSEFVKIGLSGSLINKFDKDGQVNNLSINDRGVLECNEVFFSYIRMQDDLVQFEVSKFIDI